MKSFSLSSMPAATFGEGSFSTIGDMAGRIGKTALVITGGSSLASSGRKMQLAEDLVKRGVNSFFESVTGEPSPGIVDTLVGRYHAKAVDVVVSVGGGSVIDTGKAVSAMLPSNEPVTPYLEGVGNGKVHDGRKVPFIAVPTTSGTGSEATKNAVLCCVGDNGFKKSLRHENFVPDYAIIDPELMLSCPPAVTAAAGLDVLCQLLESYISTNANPATDALAVSGLEHAARSFIPACTIGAENTDVRLGMAYGAYISGITLSSAGLGVVHGFASSIGGLFPVPHGVICGALLAECTTVTIEHLWHAGQAGHPTLRKYARAGDIVTGRRHMPVDEAAESLSSTLHRWREELKIPRLNTFGIGMDDIDRIVAATDNKNNPVKLKRDILAEILEEELSI